MGNDKNIKGINNFRDTFILFAESEVLSVDIADIYESSKEMVIIIEKLIRLKDYKKDDLIDLLVLITTQIDHMEWHNESIKKIINLPE